MIRGQRLRRGWTLVEMLVVVSIMSLLLATVAVMIQTIMRQQRVFGQGVTQQRTLAMLARQIRHDIHAAVRVETTPAQQMGDKTKQQADADNAKQTQAIRCSWPDGRSVSYQLHGGRLLRVVSQPGEKRAKRKPFTLPRGAHVRLVESEGGARPLATIEIDYPAGRTATATGSNTGARRTMVIEALVGRDLRWQVPDRRPKKEESGQVTP